MRKLKLPKLNWRSNRKLRLGATATAITVVIVAIIVLVNVVCGILANRFPWTLDLTADKTYSLSAESIEIAKGIQKDVQIEVLLSEDYFANPNLGSDELNTVFRQFYLFTKEYESLSGGKVTTKYVDLEKNPTLASQYQDPYEAESGDILFLCDGQYRVVNFTALWQEDTDNYTYYTVQSLTEQKLATNISSVCGGKTITVTFLTGHGENESAISSLKNLYELNGYTTQVLDFKTAGEINETTEAIAIVGPAEDYSETEVKRLREWLNNDGKLGRNLFVYAGTTGVCPNLYGFLSADYGIGVTNNIIIETDQNNYPLLYDGSGPYFPYANISSSALTTTTANKQTVMPLTRQLTLSKSDDERELLTNHPLITFPESSRLIAVETSENDDEQKEPAKAETYPVVGVAYAREYDTVDNQSVYTYVFVSGSDTFAEYVNESAYENEGLALEPLRTMCPLGNTVMLSGKDLSTETFTVSARTAYILGLGVFTFGIPFVLIIVALVVFFKRRHL